MKCYRDVRLKDEALIKAAEEKSKEAVQNFSREEFDSEIDFEEEYIAEDIADDVEAIDDGE